MSTPDTALMHLLDPDVQLDAALADLKDLEHNIARSVVNTAKHTWEPKYGRDASSMMMIELTASLFLGTVLGISQHLSIEQRKTLLKELAAGMVEHGNRIVDEPENITVTQIEPLPGAA